LKSLLSVYDASLIAEDLYRNMLPRCEMEFRHELRLWHRDIDARRYLDTQTYPRCWVVTASLVFATTFTEYARLLLESLRQNPDIGLYIDADFGDAERCGPFLVGLLNDTSWRKAICTIGSNLYILGLPSLTRAFALGLHFAFVQPDAARMFVDIVRETVPRDYDRQVAAAASVVRSHPRSAIGEV